MKWLINKTFLTPSVEQLLGRANRQLNIKDYGARPKIFQPLSNRLHHW